ncbi:hypothetical protein [Crocosphaera sp.]|uniref:hypothetical protein n=1 Tax=Crocosphaera sp. TaxID=2729996 RepID=UPI00261A08F9|nr:hypothetical protein [Crocosphaera sp.]MDJ0579079.1 hypothetical protein [Crocosphaera sp.]
MLIPVEHLSFLAQFKSYGVSAFEPTFIYDIPLISKYRAVIVFDGSQVSIKEYQGFIVFGNKKAFELKLTEESMFATKGNNPEETFAKLQIGLSDIAQQLLTLSVPSIPSKDKQSN